MANNSELRVISGRYRGRVLLSPRDDRTHPMGARERLALFNMVNVEQAAVLDAYAGSGAIGIEALSRGAREVVFVESSGKVASVIKQNLQNLEITDARIVVAKVAQLVNMGVQKSELGRRTQDGGVSAAESSGALESEPKQYTPEKNALGEGSIFYQYFDVIFADPPYNKVDLAEIAQLADLLRPGGTLALSSPAEQGSINLPPLRTVSTHTYARAQITIYRKEG